MTDEFRHDVLAPIEIESYVQAIEPSTAEELGSLRWLEKHDRIEKLTVQAIVQALSDREETVKESLITYSKLPVLVHDLVLVQLWRDLVFPKLMKENLQCSFSVYTILYHEATCINLIETVLYHPDAAETLGETVLDITDYCFQSLYSLLATGPIKDEASPGVTENSVLKAQSEDICFKISFKALSCLRYIIENLENVAGEVTQRLTVSTDTPMLLSELLLKQPWTRRSASGVEQEYNCDEQQWMERKPQDRMIIGKIEAQAWLGLYHLFINSRVTSSYDITEFRKTQLLRLRSMLTEVAVDQIPVLVNFQQWLDNLAIGNLPTPPSKSPLIIEMLSSLRPSLEAAMKKDLPQLMENYRRELVSPSRETMMAKAKRLSSSYDFDSFEAVLPPSKCAKCGEPATKRCSRCKNEWYCGRKCQVEHWQKHKKICDLIAS